MRIIRLFPLALLFVAACSPLLEPTPTDSGVFGHVTIGPTCPVVQVGNPCPDKPYQAKLTILAATSGRKIIEFQTDGQGYFRVALVPGQYVLHPESPGVMPHAAGITFGVEPHQFTRVDVIYDSGIR